MKKHPDSTHATQRGLGTLVLLVVALMMAAFAGAAQAAPKGPEGLGFYNPPRSLPKGHGTVVWARQADGLVPLSEAGSTRLILYTSLTPAGKRVAVSGSVSVPKGKPPEGGWPVISYAHGTTGIADTCAPSRNRAGGPVVGYTSYIDPELNAWLDAGYAVVRTDYQGLGTPGPHSFLVGKAAGRSVLDIVRAARSLDPRLGRRFLIAGHSQGGHAALFGAAESGSYTPDLRLRGTVSFAPASHIYEQAVLLPALTTPSGLTALASMIVEGARSVSGDVKPSQLLTSGVLDFFPLVRQVCLPQLSIPSRLGGIAPAAMLRSGADTAALFEVLKKANPDLKTEQPLLIAQGDADTTTFKLFTDQLVGELTDRGDKVRYSVYPGVNHGGIVSAAETEVLDWFEKRLPPGG